MAESMVGLKRTHRCTEVSAANIGETVTVMGWVQTRRNLGALIFVDLRDRSGILQILFDENKRKLKIKLDNGQNLILIEINKKRYTIKSVSFKINQNEFLF